MNKVIFSDGSEFDCLSVCGEHRQMKGFVRDCLTFSFDLESGDVRIDEILDKFKSEKVLKEITLKDHNSEEHTYFDYTLFDEMTVKDEIVSEETNIAPKVTQKVLCVTVGQISYSEKLMQEQKEQLDSMSEVISDILGGAL